MPPTDLVLSYGDLIRQSGYRTRVLGEFRHLEQGSALDPFLLAFDRDAVQKGADRPRDVPSQFLSRHASLYYPELKRLSRTRNIRVVHAHNMYSAALALSARPFSGYKVVLDLHGRIPEEYVYLGKGGALSRRVLSQLERWTVTRSDHVVVVSEKLRDYLLRTYPVSEGNVTVIPDCAGGQNFRWNPLLRTATRNRMNLSDRFVCLHLGSFLEWYQPETILRIFRRVLEHVPRAHLLVVTAHQDAAREFLGQSLSEELYTVTEAAHSGVPPLLNAADLGFLILPQTTNIHVSSPTKFSEYLNCGLPVIISPGVGDFSDMVIDHGVGCVVDVNDGVDSLGASFLDSVVAGRPVYAERCVKAGKPLLWESHKEKWNHLIDKLLR